MVHDVFQVVVFQIPTTILEKNPPPEVYTINIIQAYIPKNCGLKKPRVWTWLYEKPPVKCTV